MQRVFVAFFLLACASRQSGEPRAASEGTVEPPAESVEPAAGIPSESTPAAAPAAVPPPEPAASASRPAAPAQSPDKEPFEGIQVRNIGLHVGGGANDSASKRPFLQAVERQFPEFVRCYQSVSEPGVEGTFGVDIQVPKAGGKAKVEEPRTALPGDAFRECMVKAFEAVVFEPTAKPVVISYSLRFFFENRR